MASFNPITNDLFGFDAATLEHSVLRFASGVLSPAIWEGYRRAGTPMCLPASEASEPSIQRACDYVRQGGELLVDSGAFVWRDAPHRMPWEKVIQCYQRIAEAATVPVTFILPDVVGNQDASLAALNTWGSLLRDAVGEGHTLLLPVQLGARAPGDFVREALNLLQAPIGGLALPSNAAAFAPGHLVMLADVPTEVPRRLHFLGISRNARGLQDRLLRLADVWPDAVVSCDACEHRAHVGEGMFITETRRQALEARWDASLELGDWDDTEDEDGAALEALKAQFPDADDDDLAALLCSGLGQWHGYQAHHQAFCGQHGPSATADSIYAYAMKVRRGDEASDATEGALPTAVSVPRALSHNTPTRWVA